VAIEWRIKIKKEKKKRDDTKKQRKKEGVRGVQISKLIWNNYYLFSLNIRIGGNHTFNNKRRSAKRIGHRESNVKT